MFGADDEIEEEYYTDYAVYHTRCLSPISAARVTDRSPDACCAAVFVCVCRVSCVCRERSSKALSANIVITDHSPLIFHRIRTLAEVTPEEYLVRTPPPPLDIARPID
jgi:hypothetical protein